MKNVSGVIFTISPHTVSLNPFYSSCSSKTQTFLNTSPLRPFSRPRRQCKLYGSHWYDRWPGMVIRRRYQSGECVSVYWQVETLHLRLMSVNDESLLLYAHALAHLARIGLSKLGRQVKYNGTHDVYVRTWRAARVVRRHEGSTVCVQPWSVRRRMEYNCNS